MDFTRYLNSRKGDNENNAISRILVYYRDWYTAGLEIPPTQHLSNPTNQIHT